MNHITKILFTGIFIILSSGLQAQNTVKSLDECIQMAINNNLTLKSGRIAIEKAKAMQGSAFNIGKTNISVSQDPVSGGNPDNSLSVSQSFEFPTVYITRHSLLKAETDLERSRLEASINELVKEIASVYYNLLYARETMRILQKQDELYSRFLYLASAKFNSGETNRLEVINAERICGENKIDLQNVEKDFQNFQLLMQKWLNTDEQIEPVESELPVIEPVSEANDLDVSQTPINSMYENLLKASAKKLSLQKQQFLPEFNFSLRNQLLIKGFNPYGLERERFDKGNFMGFEAGISIPLFFGEQLSNAKAAKREMQLLQMQREDALSSLKKEYQLSLGEYRKAKERLDYYMKTGMQQAEEINRLSQLSYEKGEIGYVEYIQNLKTAIEIHLSYADAVNAYNQRVITLNFLQGKLGIKN
ncbi:MAG: TolC family protein [Dysgonamonadaceae bacterium]|jgi:cobalt-zinc-cadmium resistance protein CzcA|nr:TolC family protein [Dysgonamonadaceae bacterium]